VKLSAKLLPRRAVAWLVVMGAAAIAHTVCGRLVAGGDIIADALSGRGGRLLLALILVLLRLFLYLLAPGWALYIALRGALEHRLRSRSVDESKQ
jgi:hypothetical protein